MAKDIANKRSSKYIRYRWRFFFYEGKLHMLYGLNRGKDVIRAWSYEDHEYKTYSWSVVKRLGEPGYRTHEVAKMLNRSPNTLSRYANSGHIKKPPKRYRVPDGTVEYGFIWSKDHIMETLEFASDIYKSVMSRDKFIHAEAVPSPDEVRMELDHGLRLYTMGDDGKLIRLWAAETGRFGRGSSAI